MTIDFDDLLIPEIPERSEPAETRSADEALCLAFMGVSGGVGVSSIAIETAYHAMKGGRNAGENPARVCLIDLDFECGSLATYLDIEPAISQDVLTGDPSRIDPDLTSALISKHGSGLRLLAGRGQLGGNDAINPECVLALMDAASKTYDVLVLDVPRLWKPWTQAALIAADRASLVTELTIPALHMTRMRLQDIETNMRLSAPLSIVLSKYERRSFRAAVSLKDAQAALSRNIDATICIDLETPRQAMNCGEPAGRMQADSRFSKDVAALSAQLLVSPSAADVNAAARIPGARRRRRAAS